MAKLYFYYSAMNAGKTTMLLQSDFNYRERGMKTLCFLPEVVASFHPKIKSRIGLNKTPIVLHQEQNIKEYFYLLKEKDISCILIDEAQFLTRSQVDQLGQLVDEENIPVLAFGLRTDFLGQLFEGSMALLATADHLEELRTICFCGKKAIMTARISATGQAAISGKQVECGGNDRYVSLCRKHHRAYCQGHLDKSSILGLQE